MIRERNSPFLIGNTRFIKQIQTLKKLYLTQNYTVNLNLLNICRNFKGKFAHLFWTWILNMPGAHNFLLGIQSMKIILVQSKCDFQVTSSAQLNCLFLHLDLSSLLPYSYLHRKSYRSQSLWFIFCICFYKGSWFNLLLSAKRLKF